MYTYIYNNNNNTNISESIPGNTKGCVWIGLGRSMKELFS
jgi:hypothetical protein